MSQTQKRGSAVDDILKELRHKSAQATPPGKRSVDDILAELSTKTPAGAAPARPAPPAAPVARPVAAPKAVSPAKPVSAPTATAAPAAPVARPVAAPKAVSPAKPVSAPVATAAPTAMAATAAPVVRPAAPASKAVTPAKPMSAPAAPVAGRPATPAAPLAAAPAPEPPPAEPRQTMAELHNLDGGEPAEPPPRKKRDARGATIYDIDLGAQATEHLPRVGKAAALDKVDPEKFTQDAELLSWFSDEGEPPASKKEQRQLEKERKKRLAEERRDAKRAEKEERRRQRTQDDDDDDSPGEPLAPLEAPTPVTVFDGEADGDVTLFEPAPARGGLFAGAAAQGSTPEAAAPPADLFGAAAPPPAEPLVPAAADTQAFDIPARRAEPEAPVPAMAARLAVAEPPQPTPARAAPEAPVSVMAAPPPAEPPKAETPLPDFSGVAPAGAVPKAAAPPKAPAVPQPAGETEPKTPPAAQSPTVTSAFEAAMRGMPDDPAPPKYDTKNFDIGEEARAGHVPTAAFTQEFGDDAPPPEAEGKNLFVDDRFREFFGETVVMERQDELAEAEKAKQKRKGKRKKSRSAILTGEFGQLAEQARGAEAGSEDDEDDADDYNHLQDAEAIEEDIEGLRATLTRRTVISAILGGLLLWLALADTGALPFPQFEQVANDALVFTVSYLVLLVALIAVNFTTVGSGIVGLAGEPTVDAPPALAAVAALLQGVMLLVQALGETPAESAPLFGAVAAFMLAFNTLGKRVRAVSILANFQLASAGFDHSAAYVVDDTSELAYNITKGLNEEYPTLLVSRPTALVKGFLRQSFSQRASDRRARLMGWVLLGIGLAAGVVAWFKSENMYLSVSAFAAALCISAPFSSSLVSGIPSLLLQKAASRMGAVVPGWSAIEELGRVNVVMATARDIFPPGVVTLKGIKTFEKERIDLAILYAASVLVDACGTLRDIFMAVIQGKSDMLYKVESLTREPQRGFTAWVQNSRVVIGTREMLQKHDIEPPPIELEMKFVPAGHLPVYLAVSGKLFAMFIIGYGADADVRDTLHGLIRSGVSLLIDSDDMNVTGELVEKVYSLPAGAIKVLGRRELELLEPMTGYLPESRGVMTHIGTFSSFIGGMRAAAACASGEKMAGIVQIASMLLAGALCLLLVFSDGLGVLSVGIALAYQLGWTLLVSALPAVRKY